jgi:hypothetical protein
MWARIKIRADVTKDKGFGADVTKDKKLIQMLPRIRFWCRCYQA